MSESRYLKCKRNERERRKNLTLTGKLVEDLPEWGISARKAQSEKKTGTAGDKSDDRVPEVETEKSVSDVPRAD